MVKSPPPKKKRREKGKYALNMKINFVYCVKAEARRQNVSLFDLSWEYVS